MLLELSIFMKSGSAYWVLILLIFKQSNIYFFPVMFFTVGGTVVIQPFSHFAAF